MPNIFSKATLDDVSAVRAKMTARMAKKNDDQPVSPPDGGSDFKKQNDDQPVSPPDGGSDFKKNDDGTDTDNVGNADLNEHDAVEDDSPAIITIIDLDDDDDDTDVAGKDAAIADSDQGTDADAKNKENGGDTSQESLSTATEDLISWFKKLISSKIVEAEWAENDVESIKKDLAKLPVFVGPATDENSDKTITAFTPKQIKSFITDIGKARSVLATFVNQCVAISLDKKYDYNVSLQFVTRQLNSIESPFLAVFHASSADGKLSGIGEHNIKKPKPKSDRVADLGWTGDQADKLCNALREEVTAYFKELEGGYKKIVDRCTALDKELQKKAKDGKDSISEEDTKEVRSVGGVMMALTTGYRLCDNLVKRAFEACSGTFVQLGKIYPIRQERN